MPPARFKPPAQCPLQREHQNDEHSRLQRCFAEQFQKMICGVPAHFSRPFSSSNSLSSRISLLERRFLDTKCATIGFNDPPKTRSKNVTLAASAHSLCRTSG